MVKIKEYPPLINIRTIIEDKLVGAKSQRTVLKRLKELHVKVHVYEMVKTQELFDALLPEVKSDTPQVFFRRAEPFKLT